MTTIAMAIVRRAITLKREPSNKLQRTDTKKDAKKIKIDNFKRSNKEKSNIAIAILEKWIIGWHQIISYFGGSNNIFADCRWIYKWVDRKSDRSELMYKTRWIERQQDKNLTKFSK